MLTAKDLVPESLAGEAKEAGEAPHPAPLVPGSATAKALCAAWHGKPVVVVDSPPGGGKTQAAATIAAHLAVRAGLKVFVAFPTRMQAVAFSHRVVSQVQPERVAVVMSNVRKSELPRGVADSTPIKGGSVTVKTVASLAMSTDIVGLMCRLDEDLVLIVDEGYQVTLAEMTAAAAGFSQVVVLGDPGQIGPVVTHDVSLWQHGPHRPQTPAAAALRDKDGAKVCNLDGTWRLGTATVGVLAPYYRFEFVSHRPERSASLSGRRLNEIERLVLPDDESQAAKLVADRAADLVGAELSSEHDVRPATARDVAVVVARNTQVTAVSAFLADLGLDGIAVGTADRMQGGEWPLVVALDPCYGAQPGDTHATDSGRACVMMSRHTTHLTWAHDDKWEKVLQGEGKDDVNAGLQARRNIMAMPVVGQRGARGAA